MIIGELRGIFWKWGTERRHEHLETRKPGSGGKISSALLLPRPRGRGGFVNFGIISDIGYWLIIGGIIGGFWEIGDQKESRTPENAETGAEAKIPSFRLLPRAPVFFRGRLVAVVSLVSELYPV